MPNTDFRVSVHFFDHPKTVRLQAELGESAVVALLRLFAYVAIYRPKGQLDPPEVERGASWRGEPGALLDALERCRFLDRRKGGSVGYRFALHGWIERNGYASFAERRSESARQAANIRWQRSHAAAMRSQCESNAPSPSPSPSPVPALQQQLGVIAVLPTTARTPTTTPAAATKRRGRVSVSPDGSPPNGKGHPMPGPAGELLRAFDTQHRASLAGMPYMAHFARDQKLLADPLRVYGLPLCLELVEAFFREVRKLRSGDPKAFTGKKAPDVRGFVSAIPALLRDYDFDHKPGGPHGA